MPVFECRIEGEELPRLVKASSGAAARAGIVTAKAISAERMAELLAEGVTLSAVDNQTGGDAGEEKGGD